MFIGSYCCFVLVNTVEHRIIVMVFCITQKKMMLPNSVHLFSHKFTRKSKRQLNTYINNIFRYSIIYCKYIELWTKSAVPLYF